MKNLKITTTPEVESVFNKYPNTVRTKMVALRKLILEAADEAGITDVEENLKWGEPSYVTKNGSTVKMNWKKKCPDQCAMYFTCSTGLVPTFKKMYYCGVEIP